MGIKSLNSRGDSQTYLCSWQKYLLYIILFIIQLKTRVTTIAALIDTGPSKYQDIIVSWYLAKPIRLCDCTESYKHTQSLFKILVVSREICFYPLDHFDVLLIKTVKRTKYQMILFLICFSCIRTFSCQTAMCRFQ